MIFPSSLEGAYRQKEVTIIQIARTTLQITNLTQLGPSTVKLCLKAAVFHKAYNDQLHQFGPEVFCTEITWLVTPRRCNFTCESISNLGAYDWHCPVILTALYLIHSIWYDKICTVVRLNKNWKITSSVIMIWSAVMRKRSLICFNSILCECATYFLSKCVTRVWIS